MKNFFQSLKKGASSVGSAIVSTCEKAVMSPRFASCLMLLMCVGVVMAQNSAGDYSAGTTALGTCLLPSSCVMPLPV